MSGIYELVKDRKTYSVDANQTVLEAARLMTEHNIGAIVVLSDRELVGIFSERDTNRSKNASSSCASSDFGTCQFATARN